MSICRMSPRVRGWKLESMRIVEQSDARESPLLPQSARSQSQPPSLQSRAGTRPASPPGTAYVDLPPHWHVECSAETAEPRSPHRGRASLSVRSPALPEAHHESLRTRLSQDQAGHAAECGSKEFPCVGPHVSQDGRRQGSASVSAAHPS